MALSSASSGWSGRAGSCASTSIAAPAIQPSLEGALERRLVDERAARGVDQVRGRLHGTQLGLADQSLRLGRGRRVQRDVVGLGEQAREVVRRLDARLRVAPGGSRGV